LTAGRAPGHRSRRGRRESRVLRRRADRSRGRVRLCAVCLRDEYIQWKAGAHSWVPG